MLVNSSIFKSLKKWCEKNDFVVTEKKDKIVVKCFDKKYVLAKIGEEFEFNEESMVLWNNYRTNYFIPGISLRKTKVNKICPNFNWEKYKFGRIFYNEQIDAWFLYGTYMIDETINFSTICRLSNSQMISALGNDFDITYWEKIYR